MHILFISTEWPTREHPSRVPFLVQYKQHLEKRGVKVDVFHFEGRSNPINYVKAWFAIRKQPGWHCADILHAHWGQSSFLGLFSKKPLVITFHGSDLQGIVNRQGKYLLLGKILVIFSVWMAKRADRNIVVSSSLQRILAKHGVTSVIIPMGVDLSVFKPMDRIQCRMKLGLDPAKKYILFVSDPTRPEKRFSLAKSAVEMLITKTKDTSVELLVVNKKPNNEIPYYLNAGNLLLLSSLHEGAPVILKEALACNLPIVSVDVGDVKERIGNINGCYICPDDSPESIAECLRLGISRTSPIEGRHRVMDLSWDVIANRSIEVYQECLQ